jgi:tetratricopeptide (TPR) repeat protein
MSGSPNQLSGMARRLALALVVCGALGSIGWLWWSCVTRPDINFLPHRYPAEWIVYPSGPRGTVNPRLRMGTVFRHALSLERLPAKAVLSVCALRDYELSINGHPGPDPTQRGQSWKQPDHYDLSRVLRIGTNEITVTVFSSNSPPALWLSLDADGSRLNSGETWQASYAGAAWRQARLASKPKITIPGSTIYGGEEPWPSLRARWPLLLLFALVSGAAYWLLTTLRPRTSDDSPGSGRYAGLFTLAPVLGFAALWAALFANNVGVLPNLCGFDADAHMAHIGYIQKYHSLPRADEGWEMFQPPLYYMLGSAWLSLLSLSVTQDGGVIALRVMGLAIGIGHFVLVWMSLRLLFPGERSKQIWGLVLAAALPPLLYLSQYVSNEGLAAALVTASIYLTLRMLKERGFSWKAFMGLGICLGAAMLTKSTALLAVPVIALSLLVKAVSDTRSLASSVSRVDAGSLLAARSVEVWRWVGGMGLALGICALMCGWHYARLWLQFGNPLIGVWDPRLGFSWWQDDGYRTSAFYLRFGAVLAHPWFSSFKSFGDGIYATLWGDGLFGGMADSLPRPPWNYDLMAVGYWLALLPAFAVVAGAIMALRHFLRKPSSEWLLLLGVAFLAMLAVLHMSIMVPYQCHVKAFYGLCALVPFCAFGAIGFDLVSSWSRKLRTVICILLAVWAATNFAAFWVARSAVATHCSRAHSLWREERKKEAVAALKSSLERNSKLGADGQSFLAYLLMETGDLQGAEAEVRGALRKYPDGPQGHLVLAALLNRQQRFDEAAQCARRAVELGPSNDAAFEQLAGLLVRHGHAEEAIRVAREGLAVAPFNAGLRFNLGLALLGRGDTVEGIEQLQLASAINPKWAGPRYWLGATLIKESRFEEAMPHLQEALRLDPTNAEAHSQLATALTMRHQTAEAIEHYTEALRLQPDYVEVLNNLAWIRAASARSEFRDGAEAVRLAERACKATDFKEPVIVGTLAAAYAESGQFEVAVATAKKARELALAAGQQAIADKNQQLIELFNSRQPYRETTQPAPR